MNELIIKECPDAALILFALDDESSLDEAETILKVLQKNEFLFTQVRFVSNEWKLCIRILILIKEFNFIFVIIYCNIICYKREL